MGIGVKAIIADHVFTDSFCFAFGLGPDLAVDVEPCVTLVEDFLYEGKPDELFPQKQGKDFVGEDLLDNLIMEKANMMEGSIRGGASFCNQDMDMRMEVDAVTESLRQSNYVTFQMAEVVICKEIFTETLFRVNRLINCSL